MRKSIVGVGVVALAAATLGVGATAGAAPSPRHSDGANMATSTSCFKTFQSGSGAAFFRWCFSDHGNIVDVESPVTFEHLNIGDIREGYAVCANGVTPAYDFGSS